MERGVIKGANEIIVSKWSPTWFIYTFLLFAQQFYFFIIFLWSFKHLNKTPKSKWRIGKKTAKGIHAHTIKSLLIRFFVALLFSGWMQVSELVCFVLILQYPWTKIFLSPYGKNTVKSFTKNKKKQNETKRTSNPPNFTTDLWLNATNTPNINCLRNSNGSFSSLFCASVKRPDKGYALMGIHNFSLERSVSILFFLRNVFSILVWMYWKISFHLWKISVIKLKRPRKNCDGKPVN